MLGLRHHGNSRDAYESGGVGDWAPIMGVAYGKESSTWSNGQYDDADNPMQDDLFKMDQKLAKRLVQSNVFALGETGAVDVSGVWEHGVKERVWSLDMPARSGFVVVENLRYVDSTLLGASTSGSNARLQASLSASAGSPFSGAVQLATRASQRVMLRVRLSASLVDQARYGAHGQFVIRVRWQASAPPASTEGTSRQESSEAHRQRVAIAAGVSGGVVALLLVLWIGIRLYRHRTNTPEQAPLVGRQNKRFQAF